MAEIQPGARSRGGFFGGDAVSLLIPKVPSAGRKILGHREKAAETQQGRRASRQALINFTLTPARVELLQPEPVWNGLEEPRQVFRACGN